MRVNLKILQYVISTISYLAKHEVGTFNCVFVELRSLPPEDNFFGELLRSAALEHIPRLVLTDSFTYGYEIHPNKPSLLVIHAGSRNVLRMITKQFFKSLHVWDPSSRLLLLVEADYKTWYSVKSFNALLHKFNYHKVTTLGISNLHMMRYDAKARISESKDPFIHPSELFIDGMRKLNGKEISYNIRHFGIRAIRTQTGLIGPDIQWLKTTAKYLNATLRFVKNPCSGSVQVRDACYVNFLNSKKISISLDQLQLNKLTSKHMLFSVATASEMIMVPNGRPLNVVELFQKPFTLGTWMILFVVLGVMETIKQLFPKHFRNDPILLSICGIEKYNLHIAEQMEKIAYISLIIMFFLTTSAYESKLIALMTERPSTQVINTFEDLIESGIPIKIDLRIHPGMANDSVLGQQVVNGTMDWDGVSAFYTQINVAKIILTWPINYDLVLERKRYVALPETLGMKVSSYVTEMRSPLLFWLHWTQQLLFETGVTDKVQEVTVNAIHKSVRRFWHREGYEAIVACDLIKFSDFAPAWISLGVGLFASGCVFLSELLGKHRKQKQMSKAWWT